MTHHLLQANEETRQVWNRNAAFWDARMGEGNDFMVARVRAAQVPGTSEGPRT